MKPFKNIDTYKVLAIIITLLLIFNLISIASAISSIALSGTKSETKPEPNIAYTIELYNYNIIVRDINTGKIIYTDNAESKTLIAEAINLDNL